MKQTLGFVRPVQGLKSLLMCWERCLSCIFHNVRFNEFLRSTQFAGIDSSLSMSLNDVACDYGNEFSVHGPCNQFIVPKYFIDHPEGSRQKFLNRVRVWVDFLRQDQVRPYWCDIEGVGVMPRAEFEPVLPF